MQRQKETLGFLRLLITRIDTFIIRQIVSGRLYVLISYLHSNTAYGI